MVTISWGFWYAANTPAKADAAMTHTAGCTQRLSAGVAGVAVCDVVMTVGERGRDLARVRSIFR